VFLRICEDRGIENYGRLQALQNGTNAYKRLVQLFPRQTTGTTPACPLPERKDRTKNPIPSPPGSR